MAPKFNLVIETERLILRPFTFKDIEASYQMNLDEEVSKYTGDGGVVSRKEIERRIVENVFGDYKKYGFGRLAIELKETSEFIGFTGLKYLDDLDQVDIGYRLIQKYWGKGFATESAIACIKFGFETLRLDSIIAIVLPENKSSINVLHKLGFIFTKKIIEDGEEVLLYTLKHSVY